MDARSPWPRSGSCSRELEHARDPAAVQFSYSRVLNGFSAPLDARAVAVLERRPEVAGVYPVRAAYPASVSSTLLGAKGVARGVEQPAGAARCPATTGAA